MPGFWKNGPGSTYHGALHSSNLPNRLVWRFGRPSPPQQPERTNASKRSISFEASDAVLGLIRQELMTIGHSWLPMKRDWDSVQYGDWLDRVELRYALAS